MRKAVVIICNLILIYSISNFCYAQTDVNEEAKEIESLKLKSGQIIDHKEITPINFKTQELGKNEIIYSYIGDEVENANNIIFKENNNYSNTEKLDNTHFRIYSAPLYFKDENNFIHKIETKKTTLEIWNEANVSTLIDKITNLLKTPYAIAGTSYAFNDEYIANYEMTSYYDTRTALTGKNFSSSIVAYNFVDTVSTPAWYNFRTPLQFNLSLIDPTTIQSGTINLYTEQETSDEVLQSYAFYKGTQANPPTLDDYNNFTNDQYSNIIADDDIVNTSYNDWTLNTDGINYLKSGNDKFMFVEVLHDIGSTTPPNILDINYGRSFNNSTESIETRPYIELTVSGGGTGTTTALACDFSNTDISIITGCSVKIDSTGTTTTFYTYYSPFILYAFVYGIIFIILFLIYLIYYTFKK